MVTVEELQERFGEPQIVAPWGECLIIPGSEFDAAWRAELAALGLVCRFGDWDRRSVVFVQLKRSMPEGKVVYVPPSKPEVVVHGNLEVKKVEKEESKETKKCGGWINKWAPEEDKVLLDAVGDVKFGVNRLIKPLLDAGKLPGRTLNSCLWRVSALRKKSAKKLAQKNAASEAIKEKASRQDIADQDARRRETAEAQVFVADPFKAIGALSQIVDKLQKDLVELQVKVESTKSFSNKKTEALARVVGGSFASNADVAELKERLEAFEKEFVVHKHADKTGEAMVPPEAS